MTIPPSELDDVVAVLCDAFHSYPVMRFIIGPGHENDYAERLRKLVGFFTFRRMRQGGPLLGIRDGSDLVAAAVMTLPGEGEMPADVAERRDALWNELGDDARVRQETYMQATRPFVIAEPHHHLNMIGVRHSHMGRGLARPLLDAVAAMSQDDPGSHGVSLTTEVPKNLTLYEHFGYRVVGHVRVAPELETWGLYRPTDHQTRA